jgi:hypothetical protein
MGHVLALPFMKKFQVTASRASPSPSGQKSCLRRHRIRPLAPDVVLSSEGVFDQAGQLVRRAVDRLMQGRRVEGNRERLMALQTGFHGTTQNVRRGLRSIFIGQMDLHSRDVPTLVAQGVRHDFANMRGKSFAAVDVMIGVDLNLHKIVRLGFPDFGGRRRGEARASAAPHCRWPPAYRESVINSGSSYAWIHSASFLPQ